MLKFLLIFIAGVTSVIVLLVVITIVNTNWRTEKFRFENFKTAEELREYIKINFPIGSHSKPLIDLLKHAKAEYEIVPEEDYSKEAKKLDTYYLYRFSYNTGWLYNPPLIEYIIALYLDQNQNLIDYWVGRENGGL